ncbi:O-acetyl-ADP-ribose deacetylase [Paenibacillus sp. PK3_47]|uniref:O-acetyl-ADP-ribose deacetylase n=1 Tax=Paenibacillus sp. PK3_47 TaxID=2072642 RepID=UPI00201DC513|nr:O-acetyl-ADP-ribose deacetylase [Paenibacillus sp. PK3_47]UQZ36678.1 O-acetyl-ADP-ribose deacetylase [Paenibacillus sp. PK3_47]
MEISVKDTIVQLIQGDITKTTVDAIVNAANTSLMGGGGVDGAIHRAGGKAILEECIKIRNQQEGCAVGEAVVTTGGNLNCRFVIHTVGPVWNGGMNNEEDKLRNCYRNSLKQADLNGAASIAFPNISTGIYNYPKDLACNIAIDEVFNYFVNNDSEIKRLVFVCFDDESFAIYENELVKYDHHD